jgi:hypothetical protein
MIQICPYCQEDAVWLVKLKSTPEHRFAMCFECDSVWMPDQAITNQDGTRFDVLMIKLGRNPDWSDLERIEQM